MALIDEITLNIKAGKGGDGVVRWIQEKFKPKGGPGGGDGGNGGNVYFKAVPDLQILDQYKYKKKFSANNGNPGENWNKTGANGDDLVLLVPIGSLITNTETGEQWDITEPEQQVLVLKGGRGGYGNTHFKSSKNTTPYESTPGKVGEAGIFKVELKLIADIGLVGLPSAGKSTLINEITNAQSKTGAYHFTTLEPHLGVTSNKLIIADIPGLIEGASSGKGLGHKFLKHIQRTRLLIHCIDVNETDITQAYLTIKQELGEFDQSLLEKPEIIALTKTDTRDKEFVGKQQDLLVATAKKPIFPISSLLNEGLEELLKEASNQLGK